MASSRFSHVTLYDVPRDKICPTRGKVTWYEAWMDADRDKTMVERNKRLEREVKAMLDMRKASLVRKAHIYITMSERSWMLSIWKV